MPYVGRQPTPSPVPADDIPDTVEADLKSGRKNLIINGAMQVAQRGTSASSVASVGLHSLDRIKFGITTLGEYTVSQSSDAPDGFGSSMKIDCTTADASPASGDRLHFFTLLEGQDVQSLKKGSASAESVTLSFWVKCTKTGDIQVNLQDNDNTRLIGNTVTINATDTWEYKTITYAGDTTGAFGNDTGDSLQIDWWLDSGSTYNSGAVPTSWEAYAAGDRAAGETLAFGDSTANDFYITGIQLELGSVATDFEHRSYGEELALCQRYYFRLGNPNGYTYLPLGGVKYTSGGDFVLSTIHFPTEMRTSPTGSHNLTSLTLSTSGGAGTWNFYWQNQGQHTTSGTGTIANLNFQTTPITASAGAYFISSSSDRSTALRFGSDGYFDFDAEL